jgi:Putative phage abortive infection protein
VISAQPTWLPLINTAHGRGVFSQLHLNFANEFDQWLRRKYQGRAENIDRGNRELVAEFFEWYLTSFGGNFGSYFSNLYHIFKFVAESNIEPKKRYTSLVRAQLSEFELNFLLYTGITEKGKGFSEFITKFTLDLARSSEGLASYQAAPKVAVAEICQTIIDLGPEGLKQAMQASPMNCFRLLNALARLINSGLKCEHHVIKDAAETRRKPRNGFTPDVVETMETALNMM